MLSISVMRPFTKERIALLLDVVLEGDLHESLSEFRLSFREHLRSLLVLRQDHGGDFNENDKGKWLLRDSTGCLMVVVDTQALTRPEDTALNVFNAAH